jgi:hypothetical protein
MRCRKALPSPILLVLLATCPSWAEDGPPPAQDPAPVIASSTADLRKAAEEEKLVPPMAVAGPFAASPIEPGPWFICLRSRSSTDAGRPMYSVFFKDGKFNSVRAAAVIDNCGSQIFSSIELDMPKSTAASPPPQSSPQSPKTRHHHRDGS